MCVYSCEGCGYETGQLLVGGGFCGSRSLFRCAGCDSLVAARTLTTKDDPSTAVEPHCPDCGSGELAEPEHVRRRLFKRVRCPRCGGPMRWSGEGIWD